MIKLRDDVFLLALLRVYDGQSEAGRDPESEHTVDEGTHHLQVDEGDIELRKGKQTFLVEGHGQERYFLLELRAFFQTLLVVVEVVGEGPEVEALVTTLLQVVLELVLDHHDPPDLIPGFVLRYLLEQLSAAWNCTK